MARFSAPLRTPTLAGVKCGCIAPYFAGLCTHVLRVYSPMLHGLMHPCFAGLCTHALWAYAMTVSGFANRPVFTTLSGLPPEVSLARPPDTHITIPIG